MWKCSSTFIIIIHVCRKPSNCVDSSKVASKHERQNCSKVVMSSNKNNCTCGACSKGHSYSRCRELTYQQKKYGKCTAYYQLYHITIITIISTWWWTKLQHLSKSCRSSGNTMSSCGDSQSLSVWSVTNQWWPACRLEGPLQLQHSFLVHNNPLPFPGQHILPVLPCVFGGMEEYIKRLCLKVIELQTLSSNTER